MITTTRRFALLGALLFASLFFQSSANATYYSYSSYNSHSYSYNHSYRYSNYYNYNNYSNRSSYWYSSYRYSPYSRYSYSSNWHCPTPGHGTDLRPVARDDEYHGVVGESFNENIKLNDNEGNGPAYTRIVSGELPPGLSLNRRGEIVGTPTATGTYTARYKLVDQDWDRSYATITITIKEPNLLPEAVDDTYTGDIDVEFSQNVINDNDIQGDGTAISELVEGELPPGLTLGTDGTVSGTPTSSGIFVAVYKIIDGNGDESSASITITILQTISYCPQPALADELKGGSSDHALWIPAISRDLLFTGQPSVSRVLPNGDMTITGSVEDGDIQFDVTLNYSGYTATSDSPKLELQASAYIENGGPIDPSTWEYYAEFNATLVGTSGLWNGVTITAEMRGPMAQLGFGANGKNANFGLSNWFEATIVSATGVLPDGFTLGQKLAGDVNIETHSEMLRTLDTQLISMAMQLPLNASSHLSLQVTLRFMTTETW